MQIRAPEFGDCCSSWRMVLEANKNRRKSIRSGRYIATLYLACIETNGSSATRLIAPARNKFSAFFWHFLLRSRLPFSILCLPKRLRKDVKALRILVHL